MPGDKPISQVFRAMGEFKRNLTRERTHASLAAARSPGRVGGRSRKLDAKKLALARALYDGGQTDIATICQTLEISRATLYLALKEPTR